jgi:hypothetical protein
VAGGHPESGCAGLAAKRPLSCVRLAASRVQILFAAGGHPGSSCAGLAAKRQVSFVRLAAGRVQILLVTGDNPGLTGWIRIVLGSWIRIKVKSGKLNSDPNQREKLDPDPHQSEKLDQDQL